MIIDASVAAKWFFEEPGAQAARALIASEDLKAPDLIVPEVLNALRKGLRDARITLKAVHEAVRTMELLFPDLSASILWAETALEISVDLRHHINDCIYLSNAVHLGDVMLTADEAFYTIVQKSKWAPSVKLLDLR